MNGQKYNRILQRTLRNSLIYLPTQVIVPLLGILVIPFYTRLFDPSDYGYYVIVSTTVNFLYMIGLNWIDNSTLRFLSEYKRRGEADLFLAHLFRILISSLFLTALIEIPVILLALSKFHYKLSFAFAGALIFLFHGMLFSMFNILRAEERAKDYSILRTAYMSSRFFLGILIALFWRNIFSLLLGWLISGMCFAIFLVVKFNFAKFVFSLRKRNISQSIIKKMLIFSLPFIVSGFSRNLLVILDKYLIQFLRGSAEVGIYNVSFVISNWSISFIFNFLMIAAYPAIVITWEREGKEMTDQLINDLIRIYLLISLPMLLFISIMAKPLLSLFASSSYLEGYSIMPLIAIGAFFQGLIQYQIKSFVLFKKTHYDAIITTAGALLNLLLNLMLIRKFGYKGAAFTFMVSYVFLLGITMVINWKVFNVKWILHFGEVKNILFAALILSLVLGSVTHYVNLNLLSLVLGFGLSMSVYVFLLWRLKDKSLKEITGIIKSIAK